MWTTVLEELRAGKVGPCGKGQGVRVCCPEEGGFGSDSKVTLKPMTRVWGSKMPAFSVLLSPLGQ